MIQPRPIYTDGDKFDCFKLTEPYVYTLSNGKGLTIYAGFQTDFASIPQAFWNIWPEQDKRYRVPAIVHDYLYMEQTIIVSRAFADMEFRRMLIMEGVDKFTAYLFWGVIRLFGNKNWTNYKNIKDEKTKL